MKKQLLTLSALALASGLAAFGVSPSQYNAQPAQPAPSNAPNPFQAGGLQPAPQTSANLMGGAPGAPGAPAPSAPVDYSQVPDWAKEWGHLNWDEAKQAWESKDGLFLDSRSKVEYDQGHVPGALALPLGEFDKYYPLAEKQIKKAKKLITYCHGAGCHLSNKVAQKLFKEKGFKNVASFFGGWPQWQQHHMPEEKSPAPKP